MGGKGQPLTYVCYGWKADILGISLVTRPKLRLAMDHCSFS